MVLPKNNPWTGKICHLCALVLKSVRDPGHYWLFVSTGTRPGQMQKFRDCPGHSGTLGNHGVLLFNTISYPWPCCECFLVSSTAELVLYKLLSWFAVEN